jgi:hypothetical protein
MTALFRCPECNQTLRNRHGDDPAKGCVLKCPECGARLVVPSAVANLPHPQIDTPTPGISDDRSEELAEHAVVLPVMARYMPWLMSTFLHVGMAMIFMFVAMIGAIKPPAITGGVPDIVDFKDSGSLSVASDSLSDPAKLKSATERSKGKRGAEIKTPVREIKKDMSDHLIGDGIAMGIEPDANLADAIGNNGVDTFFTPIIGIGTPPRPDPHPVPPIPVDHYYHDVVYLIDRSGSMVDMFDLVRREILLSVEKMRPTDRLRVRFHVVLFADGQPIENRPRAMTLATDSAKMALVKFLKPVRAAGKTDPIPAINRAFDALGTGGPGQVGVIHLLTDGVFPDNNAVLKTIRRRNSDGRIGINTILYGNRPPVADKVMARIAAENGGKYRFISRDE